MKSKNHNKAKSNGLDDKQKLEEMVELVTPTKYNDITKPKHLYRETNKQQPRQQTDPDKEPPKINHEQTKPENEGEQTLDKWASGRPNPKFESSLVRHARCSEGPPWELWCYKPQLGLSLGQPQLRAQQTPRRNCICCFVSVKLLVVKWMSSMVVMLFWLVFCCWPLCCLTWWIIFQF